MSRTKQARRSPSQTQVTKKRRLTRAEVVDHEENDYQLKNSRQVQKALHLPDRIHFLPKTEPQRQMIESWVSGANLACVGSAGTGKTFLAMCLALQSLLEGEVEKIVIVRSTVQVRNFGFLPGDLNQKIEPFISPYKAIVNEIMQNGMAWEILTKKGMIQFISTAFVRGITIKNAVVLFDETQNTTFEESRSVFSRLGNNSRMIVCADSKQDDLIYNKNDVSGFKQMMQVIDRMGDYFDVVNFLPADIVRSGFVKSWILACEELGY